MSPNKHFLFKVTLVIEFLHSYSKVTEHQFNKTFLEIPSWTHLEECFHSDCESHQSDKIDII